MHFEMVSLSLGGLVRQPILPSSISRTKVHPIASAEDRRQAHSGPSRPAFKATEVAHVTDLVKGRAFLVDVFTAVASSRLFGRGCASTGLEVLRVC